jgi:DNA invertase Pin-like site-specific DNA recombinase
VSTSEQDTARQHAANRAAAARYGWQPAEHADDGLSASRFAGRKGGANREDYRRMLADITADRLDLLVIHDVSRADRQLTTWAGLLDECRKHDVRIYVTSEDDVYDLHKAMHWKRLADAGTQAAMESEIKSQQIRDGKAYWASQGHPVSGAAPYGIKRINDPDKIKNRWLRDEPHPQTGPVAARIIRDVAAGIGYKVIGRALDADEIPTPGGSAHWDHRTITKIAAHPAYVGAGVIDEPTSLEARARVARTKHTGRGKAERPSAQVYRYSSVLACESCGQPVRGTVKGAGSMYRCPRGHVSIPVAGVDAYIDWLAIRRLTRRDLVVLLRQGDSSAAAEARTEAARHRAKIREATESYNADRITLGSLETITADRTAKAEAADRRAAEAETPSALSGLPDEDREVVAQRWAGLTISRRKAALRALAPRAILRHGKRGTGATPVDERVVLWPDED